MVEEPAKEVMVKVGGVQYPTIIDQDGVQRFKINTLFHYLLNSGMVDMSRLADGFQQGSFTQAEYLAFYMGIGYPVSGLAELSFFEDLKIENPLWQQK